MSVRQFTLEDLTYIFRVAHEMKEMVSTQGSSELLRGKILANLFYEPSTRTAASFIAAMSRLGGSVIPISEVHYSSVSKGESLPDTIRSLECYSDVIVIRHPEVGTAELAARYSHKPIVNAGDGIGEHPTQALLDLFTINEEMGKIDGLTVTLLGDLRNGRTVHSLARLLSLYDTKINLISPKSLALPELMVDDLRQAGVTVLERTQLEDVIHNTDVLYVTRVQKERFADPTQYEKVKSAYVITPEIMAQAKQTMCLMHPLPRVFEITMDVDSDPRAAYFRQMQYGLYVRMALLAMVLGKK